MSCKAGIALTHHLSHDSDGLRAQLGDQLLAETVGDLDFKLVVGSGGLDPALQFLLELGARPRSFEAKGLCRSTVAAGLCALKLVGATVVSSFCLGTISLCKERGRAENLLGHLLGILGLLLRTDAKLLPMFAAALHAACQLRQLFVHVVQGGRKLEAIFGQTVMQIGHLLHLQGIRSRATLWTA